VKVANTEAAWAQIKGRVGELEALDEVAQLLEWDQQTMMPSGGAPHRGKHLATISGLQHSRLADPSVSDWLDTLSGTEDPDQLAAARNLRRRHDRAVRVPVSLVQRLAEASNEGFGTWLQAKAADDFSIFEPSLVKLVALRREEVAHLGPAAHPYDHLLDLFDPGSTTAQLQPMFARLSHELADFIQQVGALDGPAPLTEAYSVKGQAELSERILAKIGFRTQDGRLDIAAHPFTVSMGTGDVRLTTRYQADELLSGLGSTIHEAGHGMYEQGLPKHWAGTGLAQAAGMGMHESQSRFWENIIGRSEPFIQWMAPIMQEIWPDKQISAEHLYGAANRVQPSLIRVEADEATYNLHIVIRFELELALLAGELEVCDLPEAWASAYERVLGIRPPGPAQGVLQDVHWSAGLFGYFPSYTIGNLYAASFRFKMEEDLPDLWAQVGAGEFQAVLDWLRAHVHALGHSMDAPEIFAHAVGNRDPVADLMAHLKNRHGALYGL
jgi:carboxypeptidase Taq